MKGILLFACALSIPTYADEIELVHFAAHFGSSYAINIATYGFAEKVLKEDRTNAFILSALTTLAIGLTYKIVETKSPGQRDNTAKAMLENSLGVAAAGFTIFSFDF